MKPVSIILLLIFSLVPLATGHAQTTVTAIDSLVIELWPDYDKPSVLVLLSGTLPFDTNLPATVTLPLPENAQFHVIARIDSKDDVMKDDIHSSPTPPDAMTFITPDLRFRLEFYLPYTVNDNQRSFDYTWVANLSVNELQLNVQRPVSASSFHTEPGHENIVMAENGLANYIFPAHHVPAGQPSSVHVEYKMIGTQLTAESLPPSGPVKQTPELPIGSATSSGINWPIVVTVVGGLIIVMVVVWYIVSNRATTHIDRPSHARVKDKGQSRPKFCYNCGEPVDRGDQFCSNCSIEL
jgi:hypothetical protein